jgi:hypothetical protein
MALPLFEADSAITAEYGVLAEVGVVVAGMVGAEVGAATFGAGER